MGTRFGTEHIFNIPEQGKSYLRKGRREDGKKGTEAFLHPSLHSR
jgi:hypothetical protein